VNRSRSVVVDRGGDEVETDVRHASLVVFVVVLSLRRGRGFIGSFGGERLGLGVAALDVFGRVGRNGSADDGHRGGRRRVEGLELAGQGVVGEI
jgi:hypothetical protein